MDTSSQGRVPIGQLPEVISVAEVAETIQASCGDHFSDSANRGDDIHAQQLLLARVRLSNENAKGLAHVMKFRKNDIANPNIPVPCKTCGTEIPNERIEAKDYAVENCVNCREAQDLTPPTRTRR